MLSWSLGKVPLATRVVRHALPNPMRYVAGKPLERWLIVADLPTRKLALANDPKIVETVMLDRDGQFPKSAVVNDLLRPLIGKGVFAQAGGDRVKDTRRIFARSLAAIPDETVQDTAQAMASDYLSRWLSSPSGRLGVTEEMSRLTVDVVSQCTLGMCFDAAQSIRFTRLFFAYHRKTTPLALALAGQDQRTRDRVVREMGICDIGAEMRDLMHERFVRPLVSGRQMLERAPFVQALVEAGRWTPGQDEDTLLDEIAVMLLAGHETTASTLSWLAFELAGRPDLQEAAARAIGGESDPAGVWRGASLDVILDALAKEALRLYPPIGFFLRETQEDVVFREKPIPAGSFLLIAPWTLHRHRKFWPQPDEFLPQRWLGDEPAPPRTSYMPFGMGARGCPGTRFATIEMAVILRELLSRARLMPLPGPPPKPLGNLTSRPDREIVLGITARRPQDQHVELERIPR
jgi:cytochrome P450